MESTQKINVLIVGASGNLGSLVVKHSLAQPNLITNILVRDPQKNKELVSQVEKAGGKVLKGDVTQPETLKGVTKGMHTVILTVSYEPHVLLEGQKAVIDDCVANGVTRIVPTEYSLNFMNFSKKELEKLPPVSLKINIREYLKNLPLKVLSISTGIFTEALYQFFFAGGFDYWGDVNNKLQVTSYEDTARFIAAAVARKDLEGPLFYVGNEVTVAKAAEIYNQERGTNKQARHLGSLEDLKKLAAEAEKKGEPHWFILEFLSIQLNPKAAFTTLANKDFSELKPETIEEVLRQKPDVKVAN